MATERWWEQATNGVIWGGGGLSLLSSTSCHVHKIRIKIPPFKHFHPPFKFEMEVTIILLSN